MRKRQRPPSKTPRRANWSPSSSTTISRWTSSRTTGSGWATRSAASTKSRTERTSANISGRPRDAEGLSGSTTSGKERRIVRKGPGLPVVVAAMLLAGVAAAKEHPGEEYIERNGYQGPSTCEAQGCHPGTAKEFLDTVHWKHASPVPNVEGLEPGKEYGMKNRIYTMCNGNDIVNHLKEIPASPVTGKTKFAGCNTCHPGNHISDVGSVGKAAKNGMVCVDCHAAKNHRFPTGFDPNNWASDGIRVSCEDCHKETPHKDGDLNRHVARIACQTCHIPRTGGAIAKDFTRWTQGADKFYEPPTLSKEANETTPVYAWYNKTVRNEPHFIGPKGSRGGRGGRRD